jgi:hypothetical protein
MTSSSLDGLTNTSIGPTRQYGTSLCTLTKLLTSSKTDI